MLPRVDAEMDEVELPCDAEREPVVVLDGAPGDDAVLDASGSEWEVRGSVWPVCVN